MLDLQAHTKRQQKELIHLQRSVAFMSNQIIWLEKALRTKSKGLRKCRAELKKREKVLLKEMEKGRIKLQILRHRLRKRTRKLRAYYRSHRNQLRRMFGRKTASGRREIHNLRRQVRRMQRQIRREQSRTHVLAAGHKDWLIGWKQGFRDATLTDSAHRTRELNFQG